MGKVDDISKWLRPFETVSSDCRYYHLLLTEDETQLFLVFPRLRQVILEAHDDAIKHIKKLIGKTLDPLSSENPDQEIDQFLLNYPSQLEMKTLKGYFGEIFTGIIAENFSPFGISKWEVPAYFFRYHDLAFDQLENWRTTGAIPGVIPGRTGDDGLAFLRDSEGNIVYVLCCEAKCSHDHDASLINDAHKKISSGTIQPIELLRIIEIMQDRTDDEAFKWIAALRKLWPKRNDLRAERYDLVCYICGRSPNRGERRNWISVDKPHMAYRGGRKLEAVEIHLHDVDGKVKLVYGKN